MDDPVDEGTAISANDPAAAGGKYGNADIVTKTKYRDQRVHVEFLVMRPGGNSGVYLRNRYEIQILDGDKTKHGMAAVINETESPYHTYNGTGKWNAYDIQFRAARFDENGKLTEKPLVNCRKVHTNRKIDLVEPDTDIRSEFGLSWWPEDIGSKHQPKVIQNRRFNHSAGNVAI